MKDKAYKSSVIATATVTNKSENQDSIGKFESEKYNAIFVADGMGTFKFAKQSSERIVEYFKTNALEIKIDNENGTVKEFLKAFRQAKEDLISYANHNSPEEYNKEENLYGTTAITLYEIEEKVCFAYVGNGAIWHIRGNFSDFPESHLFPWNAINYLNPHSIPEQGKEALYRFFSNSDDFSECIPTVTEVSKDKIIGDIFMICTDGIYSRDQLKTGQNDKGFWIRFEPTMKKFFEYLKRYFITNQSYDKESIENSIRIFLEEQKPTFGDDATLGILITKEALNYQNKINWSNKDENNSSNEI